MPTVPINITGASYTSRSLPLSAQVTRNFYPELIADDPSVKSRYVLHSTPGFKVFGTSGTGVDRGIFEHLNVLYKVTGTTVYWVNSIGAHTVIGTIAGADRCIFAGIGTSIVIVARGRAYTWDGTTFAEVSDQDLETPNAVAHLNNQIIYDGDNGRFATSDVGDPTSINGLNYATAESHADDLIRPYVHDQILYLFGSQTVERWYNSGVGNPPFDRLEGGISHVGLRALHSVASNDRYLYWLGDDDLVYRDERGTPEQISTIAIAHAFSGYPLLSDAIGWCFTLEGRNYYALTLPSANKTFCYSESGVWFELSSDVNGGRSIANSYVYAYRKHLFCDYRNGNIYEFDLGTYTENGEEVQRTRDTGPIHGGLLGNPGKRVEMDRFELIMETGVGTLSGQGADPRVMLSMSDDGGRTFGTEMWATIGDMGEHMHRVEWHALGSFVERILRIRISDPVEVSIHSAAADMRVGI